MAFTVTNTTPLLAAGVPTVTACTSGLPFSAATIEVANIPLVSSDSCALRRIATQASSSIANGLAGTAGPSPANGERSDQPSALTTTCAVEGSSAGGDWSIAIGTDSGTVMSVASVFTTLGVAVGSGSAARGARSAGAETTVTGRSTVFVTILR